MVLFFVGTGGWCDPEPLALDEIAAIILKSQQEGLAIYFFISFPATLKYPTALIQNRWGLCNDALWGLGLFTILTVPL